MDVALGIESLIPSAEYFGSITDNTKESFDNLNWLDERPKPTWKQVQDAYNTLPEEIKNPEAAKAAKAAQKAALLDRLGITEDEARLLLG
jgi:hypothetical protein